MLKLIIGTYSAKMHKEFWNTEETFYIDKRISAFIVTIIGISVSKKCQKIKL